MSIELMEKVSTECAGIFFEATRDHDPNFGVTWDEGTKLIYFSGPHSAFSRVRKLFLPKPLRQAATRSSTGSDLENFHIFHYPLNERRVKKQIEEMADTEKFFWERVKDKDPGLRGNIKEPFDAKAFFVWFKERFSPASVVYSDLWGYSLIIGRRSTNQELMDYLKLDPSNFFDMARNLSPIITRTIDSYQSRAQTVHIYDLLKAPKEVHLLIDK
jgi:hypothetical protein